MNVLIVGCGYVGERLASRLRSEHAVGALVRSAGSAARLKTKGITAVARDLDGAIAPNSIDVRTGTALFYLAPPPAGGESDPRLAHFLHACRDRPAVFVYMSTTGVYGDTAGAPVDEQTPVNPMTERALRRVNAESMVRTWCTEQGVRRVVLRVPGIYGPHRLPLDRLARREPAIRADEAGIGNRIHVDDLATACAAVLGAGSHGIYNVTDGNPVNVTEFLRIVARIAGLPAPPEIPLEEAQLTLSPSRLSFLNESRRVSNRRMVEELGVRLRYADVEAGVRESLREQGWSHEAGGLGQS